MASEGDTVARAHQWLYVVIVVGLSIYLIVGVVVWGWLLLTDRDVPTGFATVLSAIIGGLIGVLAPVRPPSREPVEP
jgi:hypothetical protein